jgi:hypothetical protein
MFVRFRQSRSRLQVSLLETRRIDGHVRNEHVASFGSVDTPQTVETRIVFWQRLHERLAKLANRVDAGTQAKLLTDIHARIPMVTPDQQRGLQLRNAESDEQLWTSMRSISEDNLAGLTYLANETERRVAEIKPLIENAEAKATTARDRIARIKQGEAVGGGLGKPRTREEMIALMGLSKKEVRHCLALAELTPEEGDFEHVMRELRLAKDRAEHATVNRLLRNKRWAESMVRDMSESELAALDEILAASKSPTRKV